MAEKQQYTQFKIMGKVNGLKGNMVLKIEDHYLNLSPSDRFTFNASAIAEDQLTMQVVVEPVDQRCILSKSSTQKNRLDLNISCQTTPPSSDSDTIASL